MKLFKEPSRILSSNQQDTLIKLDNLGELMLNQKRYIDAANAFSHCLKIVPNSHRYRKFLGDICHMQAKDVADTIDQDDTFERKCKKLEFIINLYEKMTALLPDFVNTHQELANYRHKLYILKSLSNMDDTPPENALYIENLIFQGGGIKGLAYKSAYQTLIKLFVNAKKIKRIGGTSAGALTALPIALGYKSTELEDLVDIDFTRFFDGDCSKEFVKLINKQEELKKETKSLIANFKNISSPSESTSASANVSIALSNIEIFELIRIFRNANNGKMGLFKGDYFRESWAEKIIQQKTGIAYLTFRELRELHLKHPDIYKDLYVTGVNLNSGKPVVFSYESTPDAIISDALRITMSIPGVFVPHKLYMKNSTGARAPYNMPNALGISPNDLFVDGGVMMNYPLTLFDHARYLPDYNHETDKDVGIENPFTLGFRLVDPNYNKRAESPEDLKELLQRIAEIGVTLIENDNDLNQACKRSIYINHSGISAVKFNINDNEKEQLFGNGTSAVQEQLPNLINKGH